MTDPRCPGCGEEDLLRGARRGDRITITCETCGVTFERDPAPRCPTCGSDDVIAAPKAMVEKVRGDQMSIVGVFTVHLCVRCDHVALDRHLKTGAPVMPDELPVSSRNAGPEFRRPNR